ncbi:MAG TPA: TPM domain-containing protein [Thermoanaerobaculia bacterium]|jgi:uncharacterized membrane protein YgcG|nr:TPM domain-containing protein [Thermoanaerobaculia bacterium]
MRNVRRPSPILLLFLLAAPIPAAQAVSVEQVHSPRPAGWVVDLTATLSPEMQGELNRLGNAVKARTGAEMAVVVVDSTEGVPSREFATRLFNTWHIGQRRKHNGLLVFAALNDHKAEIVLGKGLNDEVRVQESQAVMQEEMVPRFRSGDLVGAILHGAAACAQRLLGVDVALPEPVAAATPAPVATPANPEAAAVSTPGEDQLLDSRRLGAPGPAEDSQSGSLASDVSSLLEKGLTFILFSLLFIVLVVFRLRSSWSSSAPASFFDSSNSSSSSSSFSHFSSLDSSSNSSSSSGSSSSNSSSSDSGFGGGSSSGDGASGSW